jgi:hypothetical protein
MADREPVGESKPKLKRVATKTEFGILFVAKIKDPGALGFSVIFKSADLEAAKKLVRRYVAVKKLRFINVKPFLVDLETEIKDAEAAV